MMILLTLRPLSSRLGAAPTADTPECLPAPIRLHRKPAPAPRFDAAAMAAFERGEHAGPADFAPIPFQSSAVDWAIKTIMKHADAKVCRLTGFNAAVRPAEDAPRQDGDDMLRELCDAINEGRGLSNMLSQWCTTANVQCGIKPIVAAVPADVLRAWIALPQGEGWRLHRPGDAMPCDGDTKVNVVFRSGDPCNLFTTSADSFYWDDSQSSADIIAWRPA